MPDPESTAPLDLSCIGDAGLAEPAPTALVKVETNPDAHALTVDDERLKLQERPERLVEISRLTPDEIAAAEQSAAKIDFRKTTSLLSHGDDVLAGISQASRQLLTGVTVGNSGEVGQIAAAVLDGIKILRIKDLQAEATGNAPPEHKGLFGKFMGMLGEAHTAFKAFQENRKQFLDLMDAEIAKARKAKADLGVTIDLLDEQALAIRKSLYQLKIAIAAGQIALDRGEDELEALRQHALHTGDAADAADVLEFRGALANFRGKVADMRESLVGSAMLIPIIGQNRKAAETRMMKVSNGLLVVIPRLMAVASQAVVQVELKHAAEQSEKLDEASRQITLLAAKGAHDAATSAARSLAGDPRNIQVLAQVADETVKTMNEVLDIEREVAKGDREREAQLAQVRDKLVIGMQGVNQRAAQEAWPR
jgi:uncharacterized protein YaaN involved in tellurite resistance